MGTDEVDALVVRCKAGERAAWRELYLREFDFIFRVAQRLGLGPSDAEDITQEVFAVAALKLTDFQHGDVSSWLYRICANLVSGHHRRARVRQTLGKLFGARAAEVEVDPSPSAEAMLQAQQVQQRFNQVLARMAPKKREVFALFELDHMSGEQIARHLDCPVDTVWTRLARAREDFARIGRRLGALEP